MTIFNKLNQWLIAILLATIINYSIIAEDNVNKTDEKNNVAINNNNQIKDNNMQITKETIIESSKNGNIKTIVIDNTGDVDVNKDTNISDIISSVNKVIDENEKQKQQNDNQKSEQNNQTQSIKLDEKLDPNSNIKVVNITTNGSNYIDNKENKDVYIKQKQSIEIENGKIINDGANKIVINDGTKNIYVELKPEIKINCNDCNNNCNKKTNNISNSTSNKKNMNTNSSKKNNINNKNAKKTNNPTRTKQKKQQQSNKKIANTDDTIDTKEVINIKPHKTNIVDENKAISKNDNQKQQHYYQPQQPTNHKTTNKINQNIYVLNTIIGIDEDDVITEDTLKKVEIDQNNLTQIVGTPITENKANKQYKEEFINKQLISKNDKVIDDNNIKYGEVAFVDSYLDY